VEAAKVRFVRRRAEAVFRAHGYRELMPPLFDSHLWSQSSPDGSPAAQLRSDAIAALVRAHLTSGDGERFARRMMTGPLADPSANGRLRWPGYDVAAGAIIGVAAPVADAEVCMLALALGGDPGLGGASVAVNTLGEPDDLHRYLDEIAELLPLRCPSCQAAPDPLRFVSCDEEGCQALAATAPSVRGAASTPALSITRRSSRRWRLQGSRYTTSRVSPSGPIATPAPSSSCAPAPATVRCSPWGAAGGAIRWRPRSVARRRRRSGSPSGFCARRPA
jgi:hypothetical protein